MDRNVAGQYLLIKAWDMGTEAGKTGDAANITAMFSKDGGACVASNDVNPAEVDSGDAPGLYRFELTQEETNCRVFAARCVSTTANIIIEDTIIETQIVPLTIGNTTIDSGTVVSYLTNVVTCSDLQALEDVYNGLAIKFFDTINEVYEVRKILDYTINGLNVDITLDIEPRSTLTTDWDVYILANGFVGEQGVNTTSIAGQALSSYVGTNVEVFFGNSGNETTILVDDVVTTTGASLLPAAVWAVETREITGGTVDTVTNDVGISQTGADKVWDTVVRDLTEQVDVGFVDGTAVILSDFQTDISSLATGSSLATAQADLDILTGTDGVTLATLQPNYAPVIVGDLVGLSTFDPTSDSVNVGEVDGTAVILSDFQTDLTGVSTFNAATDSVNVDRLEGVMLNSKVGDNFDTFFHNLGIDTTSMVDDIGTSSLSAADVWVYPSRILTADTNLNFPTSAEIADAVWNEDTYGHTISGTHGASNQEEFYANYTPGSIPYTVGTLVSGTYIDLASGNSVYVQVECTGPALAINLEFYVGRFRNIKELYIFGHFITASDTIVEFWAYNYNTLVYDNLSLGDPGWHMENGVIDNDWLIPLISDHVDLDTGSIVIELRANQGVVGDTLFLDTVMVTLTPADLVVQSDITNMSTFDPTTESVNVGEVDGTSVTLADFQTDLSGISTFDPSITPVNVDRIEGISLSDKVGDNLNIFFQNAGIETVNTVDDIGSSSLSAEDVWTYGERGLTEPVDIGSVNGIDTTSIEDFHTDITDLTNYVLTVDGIVDTILSEVQNVTYGLSAIETHVGDVESKLDTVDSIVDAILNTVDKLDEMIYLDGTDYKYNDIALEDTPSGPGGSLTAEDVWTYGNRTISNEGDFATSLEITALNDPSPADIWGYFDRTLTDTQLSDILDEIQDATHGLSAIMSEVDGHTTTLNNIQLVTDKLDDTLELDGGTGLYKFTADSLVEVINEAGFNTADRINLGIIKVQTDKMQFTGTNDIKSTLDGETVDVTVEGVAEIKAVTDLFRFTGNDVRATLDGEEVTSSSITSIKTATDKLRFTGNDVKATLDGEAVTATGVSSVKSVTDKLDSMIVNDAGDYKYTDVSLENSPVGTGGFTSTDRATLAGIPDDVDTVLSSVHGAGHWTKTSFTSSDGTSVCTVVIRRSMRSAPIAGAKVWFTEDSEGARILVGVVVSNRSGNVTVRLTAGKTYYVFVDPPGGGNVFNFTYVAVAD